MHGVSHIQRLSCRDTAMDEPDSELRRMQQLIAYDMLLCAFPRQQPLGRYHAYEDNSVYTLTKAKAEIDLVAKHATDIADHLIAMGGTIDSKLESLKADILSAIDAKFADLARTIQGEGEVVETTALADLGARVSSLHQAPVSLRAHEGQGDGEHHDHPPSDQHEAPADHSHVHQETY